MRWDCPHCQTNLSAPDDQFSDRWTFAKCYQCQEFSVVRKPKPESLKVEGSPPEKDFVSSKKPEMKNWPVQKKPPSRLIQPKSETILSKIEIAPQIKHHKEEIQKRKEETPKPPQKKNSKFSSIVLPSLLGTLSALILSSGVFMVLQGELFFEEHEKSIRSKKHKDPRPIRTQQAQAQPKKEYTKKPIVYSKSLLKPAKRLKLRPLYKKVWLRKGPSTKFPRVGSASSKRAYEIQGWKKDWFQVKVPGTQKTAWIRNDLVKLSP